MEGAPVEDDGKTKVEEGERERKVEAGGKYLCAVCGAA